MAITKSAKIEAEIEKVKAIPFLTAPGVGRDRHTTHEDGHTKRYQQKPQFFHSVTSACFVGFWPL